MLRAPHGIKGFVIPTNLFVQIGTTKIFCYNNKIFIVLSTKRLVDAAKFLVAATKKIFVVPNFVAVTKPFFSVELAALQPVAPQPFRRSETKPATNRP